MRNAVGARAAHAGVSSARAPISKEESARLLEPWLGSGLALDELPVPRMIVVRVAPGETPDLAALRQQLAAQVPGATLDDHRGWVDRMRAMARTRRAGRAWRSSPGARRHHAVGDVRDARRDVDQPADHRGAACGRRQGRLHRRRIPAPFPAARPEGRGDRRRRRDGAVRAARASGVELVQGTRTSQSMLFGNLRSGRRAMAR